MQNCIEHAKEKGYVETLFGRRRPLPELASSNFQVRSSGRAHGPQHTHPGHRGGYH